MHSARVPYAELSVLICLALLASSCSSSGSLGSGGNGDDDSHEANDDDSHEADDDDSAEAVVPLCDLLLNPGAETGDITSWTVTDGSFSAVGFQEGSYPEPASGSYQFFAGQETFSRMVQQVEFGEASRGLAGGDLYAHLLAEVRNWNGSDAPQLGLQALDKAGALLAEAEAGPFLNAYWRSERVDLVLPAGTARLVAVLSGTRNAGGDNDSYFDELDLCIDATPPPQTSELRLGPWLGHPEPEAMSVLWETHSAMIGRISYGDSPSLGLVAEETAASDHHEIRITGLAPASTVYYRVEGTDTASKVYSFRTPPAAAADLSFVAWGDNQNGPATFRALVDQARVLEPDFLVSAGDIVQNGYEENYRGQFLGPLEAISPTVPVLVAAGNHEYYGDADATLFDLHLAQPADEHCFTMNWGSTWLLVVDSELSLGPGSPQYQCIESALDEPAFAAAQLRVAVFHRPPRVEYWAGSCWTGESAVRDYLEPMFEVAGVDLVLNGHNHLYAYSPPATPEGVTWVTTGGGGGHIDGEVDYCTTWNEIEFTSFAHHILHVQVEGAVISVTAIGSDGGVIHTFAL